MFKQKFFPSIPAVFQGRDILVRIRDPRIRTFDLRIRMRILLFSSVTFKTPTKNIFFSI